MCTKLLKVIIKFLQHKLFISPNYRQIVKTKVEINISISIITSNFNAISSSIKQHPFNLNNVIFNYEAKKDEYLKMLSLKKQTKR